MKWIIYMKIKDYVQNWSTQQIHTIYKEINVDIKIERRCLNDHAGNKETHISR